MFKKEERRSCVSTDLVLLGGSCIMSTVSGYYVFAFILLPEVQGMGTSGISSFIWNTAAVTQCLLDLLVLFIRQELLSHTVAVFL